MNDALGGSAKHQRQLGKCVFYEGHVKRYSYRLRRKQTRPRCAAGGGGGGGSANKRARQSAPAHADREEGDSRRSLMRDLTDEGRPTTGEEEEQASVSVAALI